MRQLTNPLTWLADQLLRPRSLSDLHGTGGLRGRRRRAERSGVALLVVMTTIMIVTVVVTDLAYTARVRFLVTAHRSEREQAYYLARSGVEVYKLLIAADKEIGDQIESFAGELAIDGLLDMVPQLNTGLFTMLLGSDVGSDMDVDDFEELSDQDQAALKGEASVSDDLRDAALEEGGGLFSERSWLDMPGDFSAEVRREDCRININLLASNTADTIDQSPTYQLMVGRMAGEENDQWLRERNLDARELVANLADWVDADTVRSGGRGGYEDSLYQSIEPPYLTKNAAFDTQEEIRLVEGWDDEVYARFADQFTIYGSGKLNINCEDDQIHWAILHSTYVQNPPRTDAQTQDYLDLIDERELLYGWNDPKDYVTFLGEIGLNPTDDLVNLLTDESSVYRIISTGLVGETAVTMTQVLQYDKRGRSKLLYHRVD